MQKITLLGLSLIATALHAHTDTSKITDTWSGIYLGAHFGAGAGTVDETFTDSTQITNNQTLPPPNLITAQTISASGKRDGSATGSNLDLFVGYNHPINNSKFILCGQLEGTLLNSTTMKATGTRYITNNSIRPIASNSTLSHDTGFSENSTDLRSTFSLIGRAGFLVKPTLLLYALAGGTEGNFVNQNTSDTSGSKRNQWQLGVSAGGGAEYRLNEHWSILGEYRYMHFGFNRDGSTNSSTNTVNQFTGQTTILASTLTTQHTHSNLNFNLGQVGVVYRI